MSTFEDMAKAAKAKADAAIEASATAKAQARRLSDAKYQAEVTMLQMQVLPLMEEARQAFDKTGVPVLIEASWESEVAVSSPRVSFKCLGPKLKIPSTGGFYVPSGLIVVAVIVDGEIKIKLGSTKYDKLGAINVGNAWNEALSFAIGQSVESYYEDVEEHSRRF